MTLFTWYPKYSVNNEELDEHHKKLFGIFNQLDEQCINNYDNKSARGIIEELINYSNYHFFAEEQHMKDLGYKDINKHISEHREFTLKAIHLQQAIMNNEVHTLKELKAFLGQWLLNHVIVEDKKYSVK